MEVVKKRIPPVEQKWLTARLLRQKLPYPPIPAYPYDPSAVWAEIKDAIKTRAPNLRNLVQKYPYRLSMLKLPKDRDERKRNQEYSEITVEAASLLHIAASEENLEAMQILLEEGSEVESNFPVVLKLMEWEEPLDSPFYDLLWRANANFDFLHWTLRQKNDKLDNLRLALAKQEHSGIRLVTN